MTSSSGVGSVWAAISTAGIGTALGYVAAAVVQARSQRQTKADAAGALVEAATELTDRLLQHNAELSAQLARLRRALTLLRDAVQVAQNNYQHDGAGNSEIMRVLYEALDAANEADC